LRPITLLLLASKGPLHGYALSAEMESVVGWKPSMTAIYYTLRILEEEAAVVSEDVVENGRLQKRYTITETGKGVMWQAQAEIKEKMKAMFSTIVGLMDSIAEVGERDHLKRTFIQLHRTIETTEEILKSNIPAALESAHGILSAAEKELRSIAVTHGINLPDLPPNQNTSETN
jgi:DNA-binding PadR family transcriptional regulator